VPERQFLGEQQNWDIRANCIWGITERSSYSARSVNLAMGKFTMAHCDFRTRHWLGAPQHPRSLEVASARAFIRMRLGLQWKILILDFLPCALGFRWKFVHVF